MIQNVDEEPEVERQEKIKKLKKQLQLLLEESEPKIYQFQQMTHYMTNIGRPTFTLLERIF